MTDYKVTVSLGDRPGEYDCSVYIDSSNFHIGRAKTSNAMYCQFTGRRLGHVAKPAPSFHATCIWTVRDALDVWFTGESEEWDIMVKAGGITLI